PRLAAVPPSRFTSTHSSPNAELFAQRDESPLAGLRTRRHGVVAPYWQPLPKAYPQCFWLRSFRLTAAGQFRILTGFPLALSRDFGSACSFVVSSTDPKTT